MHIQNLDKFYKRVIKILSANEIMLDARTDEQNDRQPKSNIAPTFSKRGYNNTKMMCNNPKLDLVNMNAYIKFGEILSICFQDIKSKLDSGVNQGP